MDNLNEYIHTSSISPTSTNGLVQPSFVGPALNFEVSGYGGPLDAAPPFMSNHPDPLASRMLGNGNLLRLDYTTDKCLTRQPALNRSISPNFATALPQNNWSFSSAAPCPKGTVNPDGVCQCTHSDLSPPFSRGPDYKADPVDYYAIRSPIFQSIGLQYQPSGF